MSITYRPPFDEDDERDLRALYRKPGPGANPELDAAVRRRWHPGHSWHPGWGAAACAVMVAGLFAWTDMREAIEDAEPQMQLVAVQESEAQEAAPASAAAANDASPLRRVVALQQEPAVPAQPAMAQPAVAQLQAASAPPAPAPATAETAAQESAQAPAQESPAELQNVVAFTEQDIEARVAQIRGLIVDDREEDAVQALRELQRGAPDFALPDDLQELSRQNPA